jgi:hypothetical protein
MPRTDRGSGHEDLARAIDRLEQGHGLRVVK